MSYDPRRREDVPILPTEVGRAVDAGLLAADGVELVQHRAHAWVVPKDAELVVESKEEFANEPWRKRGVVQHATVDSLVSYVNMHAETGAEQTTVWVDEDGRQITAVLDDHSNDTPAWGDHRAVLMLKLTPEWQHWLKLDGQLVGQVQFAEHVEDGLEEIVTPPAADMLEIAQSFQAHTDANFRSGNRLHSGETRFLYDEETTATAGQTGEMTVPTDFTLGISPFMGEDPYRVGARLRYRVSGGNLRIGYKLDRPHVVIHEAVEDMATKLEEKLGAGVEVYRGKPRG